MPAGLLLASYWAVRYTAPAAIGVWVAMSSHRYIGKFEAVVSAIVAHFWYSRALSCILAGSTSTLKLQYPLYKGYMTVPTIVARWVNRNHATATFLTRTVSILGATSCQIPGDAAAYPCNQTQGDHSHSTT